VSDVVLAARDLVAEPGRGARFRLQVPALALRAGSVLAVLGANGAGKTTLLRALAGLVEPLQGRVEPPHAERVALVFQSPIVFAGSVLWNATLPLWGAGLSRSEREGRARAALERFGIAPLAGRSAATLSGGERRRLALARALVTEPAVLLLDEPFDDLDAAGRAALVRDLARTIRETRVAVALVTHELRQALALADRIAVLREGALVQEGARDDVLRHPADAATAALVGMSNWLDGRIVARDDAGLAVVEIAPGARLRAATPLEPGAAVCVGIRPEHVKLDPDGTHASALGAGKVAELHSDGVLVNAAIAWSGVTLDTHLLAGRGLGHTLAPGDAVFVAIQPEDVHVVARR